MLGRLFMCPFVMLLALLVGCGSEVTSRSAGEARFGTRKVKFTLEGPGNVSSTLDSATVNFPEGKILVEQTRVLVNGNEVAKVDENVELVFITYAGKTLTITADGAKIHEAKGK
jgi:hypothetical protein